MKKSQYLIRLDDACPTMDESKWTRIESILDKYGIRPMVGIVPANKDKKLQIDMPSENFWNKALLWQEKGWAIALHGYDHVYHECVGGLNPLWNRSEFVGLSYEEQLEKLSKGKEILNLHGLNANYFFAPSHTFDQNTVKALLTIGINKISDTIAFAPYKEGEMTFIPQIGGKCRKMIIPGIYTFCFHPNTMKDTDFVELQNFLDENQERFVPFDNLALNNLKGLSLGSSMLRCAYFLRRKISRR